MPKHLSHTDTTVLDTSTGMMWQRMMPTVCYDQNEAKLYAARLRLGGYTDWRIPTLRELLRLVHTTKNDQVLGRTVSLPASYIWTTDREPNSRYAWVIQLKTCDMICVPTADDSIGLCCVRYTQ